MQSTADVTIEWLENLVRDTPPCEAKVAPTYKVPCGRPSVAKIMHTCPCGKTQGTPVHLCELCLEDLMANRVGCAHCTKKVKDWKSV